ncbi:BgTH12-06894 [Blumeria graminis f. sp. triticale]|uniref:AdoMet-dependent methyltransferase n=3 Tax=Blumeria graminis TaxID=34373 RepID=A0A061HK60_BLUGR|nr:AdoMet-dependent methyltransferase [Blumeria graminis f. sp. tritici 96224]CAD6505962.1 BgTH12-06894 [Blumeria graminis f. sp. triticale]VDB94572.1 Bgt-1080 [Blumeria graminis f. sp. tritici]
MGMQKKHGKGRLDKWYKLAKEKGYRARAAFKLIQLNKKYGFLEKSKVLLDLCAAPGSWCQVAAETMPVGSLIVGVDLSPIKAIPKVITFQSDITTDKCRATIRSYFKTWKADTVLHDGAPNVGTAWVQDSFNQAELALQAMKLATEFLIEGGTFVTKVFRSKDYNNLLWVFNQLFNKVESTKPPSSRNVSAEIFVVCRGYKAPKRIDPKFLDPRSVFAELSDPTPNNEAKVFNPEVKKRKRDGYEEGNYTQFKEIPASEFINTSDPIAILGSLNRLNFNQPPNGDVALAALDRLPETTEEIRNCCADLRVLGRKEFRSLLRWRLKVREKFGFPSKKNPATTEEETTTVEPMDEEIKIQQELQALSEKESARRKKDRRRDNEKKQREIVRMQLHMTTPMDIGLEQAGPSGEDSMFRLKEVDKTGSIDKITRGKMATLTEARNSGGIANNANLKESSDESDEEEDRLDRELDSLYELYQERKSNADSKQRAKKARKEHDDGQWEGFSADEAIIDDDQLNVDSSDDDSDGESPAQKSLLTDLEVQKSNGGLSNRAAKFFDDDVFKDIQGGMEELSESEDDEEMLDKKKSLKANEQLDSDREHISRGTRAKSIPSESEEEDGPGNLVASTDENQWEDEPVKNGKPDIDIITAEAMTLARQIASGEKSTHDLLDEGWNKYAFKDRDGLPEWFLDDEGRHDKPHRPISAAAAAAVKEKLRALNARPIKKVREAKDRKKFKAAQRLEKLRKKSAMMQDEEGMTEKDKAQNIVKLMSKAAKKKPKKQVKVVVACGGNKGIAGRPRGVKGRYKIVDARLKKDTRAEKRLAKKKK